MFRPTILFGNFKYKVKMKKIITWIIGIILLISIFLVIAVFSGNISNGELWPRIYGALIGVVISAVITTILLIGQTSNANKREKQVAVFNEKLKRYQHFLEALLDIFEDGILEPSEAIKLKFAIANIAMNTPSHRVATISKYLREMIYTLPSVLEKKGGQNEILRLLFLIINEFKEELYADIAKIDSEEEKQNFAIAVEQFKAIDKAALISVKHME